MAVASDSRNTHAQRHDKGHGHGAGGHAAGVKRHGKELLGHKGRQQKDEPIEQHQQLWQRNADEHTQKGKDQKQAHARRHREDQRAAGDGGHLICQHLQVRLGDRDKETQQKAEREDERQLAAAGDDCTHPLAHGGHAHLCTQSKEHDAHHDHGSAQQKAQQDAGRYRCYRKAEHQHNGHNGQHRLQRLQKLFPQLGERSSENDVHRLSSVSCLYTFVQDIFIVYRFRGIPSIRRRKKLEQVP